MSRLARIMVVEDNPADVLLLKEALRHIGADFTLEHYANGEEAATAITGMTQCPDLVLLDINLPRVNGLELLALIRAHPPTSSARVAMFTSSHALSDRLAAEESGADAYIVKPSGYLDFLNAVGSAIQRLLERSGARSRASARRGCGGVSDGSGIRRRVTSTIDAGGRRLRRA